MADKAPHIRWMIRRDMEDVLYMERACFEHPWTEQEFMLCLRQRNVIGMVAELGEELVGYMLYELHKRNLTILNLGVDPWYQRRGVGRAMIAKLQDKLSNERRTSIDCEVRESNLRAQLFLRQMGFTAIMVLRDHCHITGEDAYVMQHHISMRAGAMAP